MNQIPIPDGQTSTQEQEALAQVSDLRPLPLGDLCGRSSWRSRVPGTLGPCSGRRCMAPNPTSTPGTDGGRGCSSWDMPGPMPFTLGPLSSKPAVPTGCPGDVSSGQREGDWEWRLLSRHPQGLAGERPGSLFRIKKFSQDCHSHHLLFTPNILDYCFTLFSLKKKKKKKASTHRAIHYSNKIMPRAVREELLRILSLNHPNPQN